ncbi:hypothetical protein D3C77_626950 [compost metagenome]
MEARAHWACQYPQAQTDPLRTHQAGIGRHQPGHIRHECLIAVQVGRFAQEFGEYRHVLLVHIDDALVCQGLAEADYQGGKVLQLWRQASAPYRQVHAILQHIGQHLRCLAKYLENIHRLACRVHAAASSCHGPNGSGRRNQPMCPNSIS